MAAKILYEDFRDRIQEMVRILFFKIQNKLIVFNSLTCSFLVVIARVKLEKEKVKRGIIEALELG